MSRHKFIQKGDVNGAHNIALLGVTESDWRLLGALSIAQSEPNLGMAESLGLQVILL